MTSSTCGRQQDVRQALARARLQPSSAEQVGRRRAAPDRDAQFKHINAKARDGIHRGIPVISVDTKKKELVGNFKNGGRWQPEGQPELFDVHDFPGDAIGKAIPYGVKELMAATLAPSVDDAERMGRVDALLSDYLELAHQPTPGATRRKPSIATRRAATASSLAAPPCPRSDGCKRWRLDVVRVHQLRSALRRGRGARDGGGAR
jgi:hypothetical protein